jgi:hypothetical protein
MVALIGAGCSNASSENGSSGGSKNAINRDKAVTFAECMRENGVRELPDPNASGEFAYGIRRGSSLDPSSAAWRRPSAHARTCSHRASWTEAPSRLRSASSSPSACATTAWRTSRTPPKMGPSSTWRVLGIPGKGNDVRQLNRNLHELGADADAGADIDPDDNDFTWQTEEALRSRCQRRSRRV